MTMTSGLGELEASDLTLNTLTALVIPMATNPEDQHEKDGICMADVIKALVLAGALTC